MGLTNSNTTLVAPQPKGILDPNTGKPVGSDDAFFGEINNELADKGSSSPRQTRWLPGRAPVR